MILIFFVKKYPDKIQIPEDADLFYLGVSRWGMIRNHKAMRKRVWAKDFNSKIVQVFNMLTMHGILICSPSGALAIQKSMCEGYYENIIWDEYVAKVQQCYKVYALRHPLFYQNKDLGGHKDTDIILSKKIYSMPEKIPKFNDLSIKICQMK